MHFMDSIFIFGLMLVLFGPKKLPEIARQAGKLMMEFRRASNDFKMQMEDELRAAEQADRQKKYEAETQAALANSTSAATIPQSMPPQLASGSEEPAILPPSDLPLSDLPPLVQPPSVGETVHATPPNRMRVDQADAEAESKEQVIPVPPMESSAASAEEFYAQRNAELYSPVETPVIAPDTEVTKPEIVQEAAHKEPNEETSVTTKLPGTEMYPDTTPMAESEQAPIHHG
jgi:sec-independent protein translocase protein TatB